MQVHVKWYGTGFGIDTSYGYMCSMCNGALYTGFLFYFMLINDINTFCQFILTPK